MDRKEHAENVLEIHSYLPKSCTEGPGKRFTIWVQGCSIRCVGCANSRMWDRGKGYFVSIDKLFKTIEEEKDIEGLTIVGGEPFDQSRQLAMLARRVKNIGLGIIVFTGHIYELLLENGTPDDHSLLDFTDLLVDGPFIKDLLCYDLPWVGSQNQRYVHVSDRYTDYDFPQVRNAFEIRIYTQKNRIIVNGMGNLTRLQGVFDRLRQKGITITKGGQDVRI